MGWSASLRSGAGAVAALSLAAGWIALSPAAGSAQDGGGPTITADAVRIELSGRVQLQAATSPCSGGPPFGADSPCVLPAPDVDMFVRRARLAVAVQVDELVDLKIQPGFGSLDQLEMKDAWGRLRFHPALHLRLGHFKRPFDGFQLTSSTQILTIERDLDLAGVPGLAAASLDELTTSFRLSDRDVGVMASGRAPGTRLEYWLGVFNGRQPASDGDLNSAKQVVGRARYSFPVDGALPLSVAAAAASTDRPFLGPDGQPLAGASSARYGNYELWAELGDFTPGAHAQVGVVFGDNPLQDEQGDPPEPGGPGDVDFAGAVAWQAVGAYRLRLPGTSVLQSVEPVLRVTRADRNTSVAGDETWGFTPGVNVYFHGRNRLQVNWDVVSFADDATGTQGAFRTQFQVHF